MKGNHMVIEGIKCKHKDLPELPNGLSLKKAKQIEGENWIAFQGPRPLKGYPIVQ